MMLEKEINFPDLEEEETAFEEESFDETYPDDAIKSPLKAIRKFCLFCSGDSPKEARLCTAKDCPLYPFRLGKNPFRKRRELTEDQKGKLRENVMKAQAARKAG
jgi:hypothetical protein